MIEWIVTASVLIVFVTGIRYLFGRRLAFRVRYALWLVVAVRLLVPVSFAESSLSVLNLMQAQENVPEPGTGEGESISPRRAANGNKPLPVENKVSGASPAYSRRETGEVGSAGTDNAIPARFSGKSFLAGVWLAGTFLTAGVVGIMNRQYRRKVYASRKRYCAADCRIPVYISKAVDTPCMFGLFRPAVYLTPKAIRNSKAMRYVLCHEMTHYRHLDHIWAVVRVFCICVHWFNPLVWLAAGLSRQDCELACDEDTLAELGEGERIFYGRILLDFSAGESSLLGGLQLSTAVSGGKRQLKERLMMIVGRPKKYISALTAGLALVLLCSAVAFTGRVEGKVEGDIADRQEERDGKEQDAAVESVAIVSVNLGDGEKYVLKVRGEVGEENKGYLIRGVELNRVGDGEEENLQIIHPEKVSVLHTGQTENSGGSGMSFGAKSLYAKPLYMTENLDNNGKSASPEAGEWVSAASDGAVFVADVNFDGYDDFCLQAGREDGNVLYYCYLWNPEEKQFVPSYMIPNAQVNREEGLIESATEHKDGLRSVKYYRFDGDNILHMVRYTEENNSPGAIFPTLDLTYGESFYALPAVDEWDLGTVYGGALTERMVFLAKQALYELYELTGTKLDKACFFVDNFGCVSFGQTTADLDASRIFYYRCYGAEAGFEECVQSITIFSERVVWYSPVTFWQVPEGIDEMTDQQAAEWYFAHSGLKSGEITEVVNIAGEYIFETDNGKYYAVQLEPKTRELSSVYGPYDSFPVH